MPSLTPSWIQKLPSLGVGIGFRKALKQKIFTSHTQIDFLEIITEHYAQPSFGQLQELTRLNKIFPLIPHVLGSSLGNASGLNPQYLKEIASVINAIKPLWWSDHIAITSTGNLDIGHLAPLPRTMEMVKIICENISTIKKKIKYPLILENISFTHTLGGELTEEEFIKEIIERSDCGLLLDLMNLYANSQNFHYDPIEFLDRIPIERVVQLHIIGGHWEEGILVDSHSSAPPARVWELLEYVASRTKIKGIIIEWDENLPAFDRILTEVKRAKKILSKQGTLKVSFA